MLTSVSTQLFFHNLAEKLTAKLLVDMFLLLFIRLNTQLETILPFDKGMGDEDDTVTLFSF